MASAISSRQPLRYASYAYDTESGLYYLSQRYYDPSTMQFVSKDPARADGEMSAYLYCGNDPVNRVDPEGLWGWGSIWGAVKHVVHAVVHTVYHAVVHIVHAVVHAVSHVARAVVHAVRQAAHHVSQVVHHYYQRASSYVSHVFHRPSATKKKVSAALTPPRKVRPGEKNAKLAAQWAAYSKTNAAEAAHQSQVAANWDVALQAAHNVDMFVSVYGIALGGVEAGAKYMAGRAAGAATEAAIGEVAAGGIESMCFVRGTPVLAAAGAIPIEFVKPGDRVLSRDPVSGAQTIKPVLRTFVHETNVLMHVSVATDTITCTPTHRFWVDGRGWVEAGRLQNGDVVLLAGGTKAAIACVSREQLPRPVVVYNFEVEDFHTYFVADPGVWVHNNCMQAAPEVEGYAVNKMGIRHGLHQAIGRDGGAGVAPWAMLDALRNPTAVKEMANDSVKYTGRYAAVALNRGNEIVTTWARSASAYRGAPLP